MYLSFFLTSLVSFLILRKKAPLIINFSYLFITIISIIIGFGILDIKFTADGEHYWMNVVALYEGYYEDGNLKAALATKHNGIFYLGYLATLIFGNHLLSLLCFYLITKSMICIYLFNFLSRKIYNFNNIKAVFFLLFLFEPWTFIFNNFYYLKEGFVFFLSAIIVINLYKLKFKFKIKYHIIIFSSILIIFSFRYYLSYLFLIFYLINILILRSTPKSKKTSIFLLTFLILILFVDFYTSKIFYDSFYSIFYDLKGIINIILSNMNIIGPIKFIFSPFAFNILLKDGDFFRTFVALIYNFISLLLVISFLRNDFKNHFINYLYFFIVFFAISQLWAPSLLLTGGRHRSVIVWAIPILITYYFTSKRNKKYNI